MPVSVATAADPFRGPKATSAAVEVLRVPQARLLHALMPECHDDLRIDWPVLNRAMLADRMGYSTISGSVTRALNGIRYDCLSGPRHKGVLDKGLVEVLEIDLDGVIELNYRITQEGIRAFNEYVLEHGDLPPNRDADLCINDQYRKGANDVVE